APPALRAVAHARCARRPARPPRREATPASASGIRRFRRTVARRARLRGTSRTAPRRAPAPTGAAACRRPSRRSDRACAARDARPGASCRVLVVWADPELEALALVPSLRGPVEDAVVAHEELDTARPGRVRLVDRAVVHGEDAEAER